MNDGEALRQKQIEEVIEKLVSIDRIYEFIRVVDPVQKKVITVKQREDFDDCLEQCFDVWQTGQICRNCISMRAYTEKETFIKIERNEEKIFMVTAIPVEVQGEKLVIELLKDATRSMIIDETALADNITIKKLLDDANKAAVTDELTQIYNKRYIMEKLPTDVLLSNLKEQQFSLVIADIDHFKKVNDTYGHLAGDKVLQRFAEILSNNIRKEQDWVARFGGEEFLICLLDTEKETGLKIAERIRAEIEKEEIVFQGEKIRITSSFGLAALSEELKDHEELLALADKNLYEAKANGRNRVVG